MPFTPRETDQIRRLLRNRTLDEAMQHSDAAAIHNPEFQRARGVYFSAKHALEEVLGIREVNAEPART